MSKRSHAIGAWDFIVVDDITGIKKLRSETFIDGYGFNSAVGDPRHPQEIAPIIREQMAATPDPRPMTPAQALPLPPVTYFIVQYQVLSVISSVSTTFSAANTVCFNADLADASWYVDGALVATGIWAVVPMDSGSHEMRLDVIDRDGNTGTLTFDYDQPDD